MGETRGRETRIFCVHENDAAIAVQRQFVNVEISDGQSGARNIDAIIMLVRRFSAPQNIFEPPNLRQSSDQKTIAMGVHAHGARQMLLIERNLLVFAHADKKELPCLI